METATEQLSPEAKTLKNAYDALSRNDIDGFLSDFAPDILRIEFEGSPIEGTFRGIEAVTEHVRQGRGTWAEGACRPEGFITAGDKVVVLLHVVVRLKGRTDWIDGRMADVFTFRDGRITEFRSFRERDDALAWAGVSA